MEECPLEAIYGATVLPNGDIEIGFRDTVIAAIPIDTTGGNGVYTISGSVISQDGTLLVRGFGNTVVTNAFEAPKVDFFGTAFLFVNGTMRSQSGFSLQENILYDPLLHTYFGTAVLDISGFGPLDDIRVQITAGYTVDTGIGIVTPFPPNTTIDIAIPANN